jgi:N-acetyl-alpha-D-glucosaminyl L-malate synthase BshA
VSTPLTIGILCYPSLGGSGVVATELAGGLARRGHRVHVIASAPPSRRLPECHRLSFHEITPSDYPLFERPEYAIAAASAIVEVAQEHGLDLLHVHYAVPHAASAHLAREVLGDAAPALVTTLHGTDVTRIGAHPSYRSITRFSVLASTGVTVPSEFLRSEAIRLLDLPDANTVEVIPNFVDTERFAPPERRDRSRLEALFAPPDGEARDPAGPILFHVSNFRPVKRTLDLVEVLARLRRHLPARLVLVGDGPERSRTAERARELGLARSVCFLGKRTDFADLLGHADGFVLPSESESFGVAALEALSAGVPVFGYRVGGLPEVVGGDAGRLVEPNDLDALAAAVLAVVADPERRRALGRAARERAVTLFPAERALDRYEAHYRRALGRRG